MPSQNESGQGSEREAQRRFEKLVDAALNTPPKPLAEITPSKRKKKGRRDLKRLSTIRAGSRTA